MRCLARAHPSPRTGSAEEAGARWAARVLCGAGGLQRTQRERPEGRQGEEGRLQSRRSGGKPLLAPLGQQQLLLQAAEPGSAASGRTGLGGIRVSLAGFLNVCTEIAKKTRVWGGGLRPDRRTERGRVSSSPARSRQER